MRCVYLAYADSVAPRLPDVGVDCSACLSCGMVVLLIMAGCSRLFHDHVVWMVLGRKMICIYRLRSAIHGLRRSTDCAQQLYRPTPLDRSRSEGWGAPLPQDQSRSRSYGYAGYGLRPPTPRGHCDCECECDAWRSTCCTAHLRAYIPSNDMVTAFGVA